MPLSNEDHELSMVTARRGKIDSADLRQLFVNRLTATKKAILRRGLRTDLKKPNPFGLYCEPCKRWWPRPDIPEIAVCGKCGRRYRMEFVVYEEIQ